MKQNEHKRTQIIEYYTIVMQISKETISRIVYVCGILLGQGVALLHYI